MQIQYLILLFGFVILLMVFYMLIKKKFNATFSLVWISIAVLAVAQGLFPEVLNKICEIIGIDYQPTLIMVTAIASLLAIAMYLSSEITVSQNKIRELSIHISLLNDEMSLLKNERQQTLSQMKDISDDKTTIKPEAGNQNV